MDTTTGDREPLDVLAEEFVARLRAGETPAVEDYAERHPELAGQIRELFPVLLEMEQLRPRTDDATTAHLPTAGGGSATDCPTRIGEFRVLREIGRGGMGVVYEAVQESLGRHVALKVLPGAALADPRRLERFRREARAAARLHHTNIVPVFGTGEADGRHYYAMQYIAGQGLDLVVAELRRRRDRTGPEATEATSPTAEAGSTTSATLSGMAAATGRHYWQAVARLGAQAASALAYAHGQGVLHRDIKPANLLLDGQGTLWVADFGLAKLADEEDLTGAGDLLGTLRYMAPERFEGKCDARADVYALGLTLYELVTLRPAFDEKERDKLIAQVLRGEVVRPSVLNPAVPRDLETILLKAMAREPGERYQSAAELAEDLQRFAEDRPIRGRRASVGERLWRWSRRNPVVAALSGTIAILLVAVATIATLAARKAIQDLADLHATNGLLESGFRNTERKDYPAALDDYSRAARLRPDNSQVWSDRGVLFLRLGLADEAAADFEQLFQVREPNEAAWWYFRAVLRLHAGDAAGYRDTCRRMLAHFPDAASPEVVRAVVQACTLAPDGCAEPRELLRVVAEAEARAPAEDFLPLRVALLYRAGYHREVAAATNPAVPAAKGLKPDALCFRARSLAELGEAAPARASLAAARQQLDAAAALLSQQSFGPTAARRHVGAIPRPERQVELADWLRDGLLLREAGGGEHPLPLLLRARGCAVLGRWSEADAATARAAALCLGDEAARVVPEALLVERARLAAERGRWDDVAADLDQAARLAPRSYPLLAQVTGLYTAHGRHEDARRELSAAVTREPANLDHRFERGRASIRLEDWDAAADDLNAILTDPRWNPPRKIVYGGGHGYSLFPEWRGPQPLAPADVVAVAPTDPRASVRQDIARHDELYAKVIARRPADSSLKRERGRFLVAERRSEAASFYLDWLEKSSGDQRVEVLAQIAEDVVPWDEVFEPVADRYPRNAALWNARTTWHLKSGDVEKAAATLVRAAPSDAAPAGVPGVYVRAAENEELFRAVAALRPDDGALWMARYYRLSSQGDPEGATAAAVEVLVRAPRALSWLLEIARILASAPRSERVEKAWREALAAHPKNAELHLSFCLYCCHAKDWDAAVEAFDNALRHAPTTGTGVLSPAFVYSMAVSSREAFEQFTRRRPTDGLLWLARGRYYAGTQNGKDAESHLARAAELLPGNPEPWLVLARGHVGASRWKEAAAAFDKALTTQPPVPFAQPNEIYREIFARAISTPVPPPDGLPATLLALRPDDGRLWQEYARVLGAAYSAPSPIPARRAEVVCALDELVRCAPREPLAWVDRGRYRATEKDFTRAADDYIAAARLLPGKLPIASPDFPATFRVYGDVARNPGVFAAFTEKRPDDPLPWYFRASFRMGVPKHPEHAGWVADLDRALAIRDEPFLRFFRRQGYLELGLWDKAADDLLADIEKRPPGAGHPTWLAAASALAAAGRADDYQALCRRMERVWGTPTQPAECHQLALAGGLVPGAGLKPEALLELAEVARKADPAAAGPTFTAALAHCRLGRYGPAAALAREYLKAHAGTAVPDAVVLELVAAVALARDGKPDQARPLFQAACKRMDEATLAGGPRHRASPATTRAAAAVLRREVEALLQEKPR